MVTKTFARGTPCCAQGIVQLSATVRVGLNADDGADDVGAMLDNGGVLGNRIDNFHRTTVDRTEMSKGREVNVQHDLHEQLCWKLVELASTMTCRDWRVGAERVVERTSRRQLRVVQSIVTDPLLGIDHRIKQAGRDLTHGSDFNGCVPPRHPELVDT